MTEMSDTTRANGPDPGADELGPLLAGARARGMADAFALLGAPALLLGEGGRVLHANAAAARCMGSHMAVAEGRFLLADAEMNRRVQLEIHDAVTGRGGEGRRAFPTLLAGRLAARVRVLAIPGAADDSVQLLKAVLLIEADARTGDDPSAGAVLRRLVEAGAPPFATH